MVKGSTGNRSMLKSLASKSQEAKKAKEQYGMSMEEAKKYGYMKVLDVGLLDEDPDNRAIYGDDYKTDGLAEAIGTHGFRGAVIVYPYNGRYRIQSGHRTLEAAKKAGMEEVSVIITETPPDEIERRKQLIVRNLNGREYTPMIMAREVQYLYETYRMERERESEGKRPKGKIRDLVAKDMSISSAMVDRYRNLLRIDSRLQRLTENGAIPWSSAAEAASLEKDQQDALYQRLSGLLKLREDKSLTRKEVEEEIATCRTYHLSDSGYEYDRDDISMLSPELQEELKVPKASKKVNKKAAVAKSAKYLRSILDENAFMNKKDRDEVRATLEEMKAIIDDEIKRLE